MIRVVIAEDHTLIREALVRMLEESKKIDVVGQAATGAEAISEVARHKPDVLLLDVTMPEKDGIQALAELSAVDTPTKSIVLTMHEDEAHGVRAIRAGAAGYVKKSANLDELHAAGGPVGSWLTVGADDGRWRSLPPWPTCAPTSPISSCSSRG